MKRILSLLMAVVLSLSLAVAVSAEEQEQTPVLPRYTYIAATVVDLNISESTNITYNVAYSYLHSDDYELRIEAKLQRYSNSKWNTVKTWTASGMGEAEVDQAWAVASGHHYRTYATFSVYDSNGNLLESVSRYDSEFYPPQ